MSRKCSYKRKQTWTWKMIYDLENSFRKLRWVPACDESIDSTTICHICWFDKHSLNTRIYRSSEMVKVKVSKTMSTILSFIQILYLKQQNSVFWYLCSLKSENGLFSCKHFRHAIFYIKGTDNTYEKIQIKYFIQA